MQDDRMAGGPVAADLMTASPTRPGTGPQPRTLDPLHRDGCGGTGLATCWDGFSERPGDSAWHQNALAVLVVDDDRMVGQMMADGLVAMGYSVVHAQSADAAGRLLQDRHDIGVVVSDVRMPGRDGLALAFDVTAELGDARAASMVLITGYATVEELAAAMRQGVVDVLRKPCRLAELVSAVERGLDKARRRRAAAARNSALA